MAMQAIIRSGRGSGLLLLPLAVLGVLVMFVSPDYGPVGAGLAALVLASLSRLDLLLYFAVFTIPFNVTRLTPLGIPLAIENLRLVAFFVLLAHVVLKRRTLRLHTRFDVPIVIVVVLMVFAAVQAVEPMFSLKEIVRLLSNIAFFYFVINTVTTRERLRKVMSLLQLSGLLVALYAVYQYIIGDHGDLYFWVHPRFATPMSVGRDYILPFRGRVQGLFNTPTELGVYLIVCGAFLGVSLAYSRRRFVPLTALLVLATACTLTFTRAVWATFLACGLLLVLLSPGVTKFKTLLALSVTAGLILTLLFSFGLVEEALGRIRDADSISARFQQYEFSWNLFSSSPLYGVGYGNGLMLYLAAMPPMPEQDMVSSMIHNMYLFESVQMGIVGLIVFNWLLFGALWGCYRKYRSPCAPWMKEIYGGLTVTFSAVALAGMSDPGAFFLTHACYLVWLLLGISCVVPRIATAEARVQEAARFNRAKAGRTTVYGQPNVPEDSRRHVGGPA